MKKIIMSLATIAAVVSMTVATTGAYFSDSKVVSGNTFSTGTVQLKDGWQAPVVVNGLYPGADKTSDFAVTYEGSIKGDLYYGFKVVPGGAVLGDVLSFAIESTDQWGNSTGWVTGWVQADVPYTQWTKVASGLNQNDTAYYRVHVKMLETGLEQNNYQNLTALADIVLYAVQEGGPSPLTAPKDYVALN